MWLVDPQAYAVDVDIDSDHFVSSAEEKEAVHQRAMRQRATGKFEPSARGQATLGTVHVNNVVIRNVTGRATTPGVFKCNDAPYNCMNNPGAVHVSSIKVVVHLWRSFPFAIQYKHNLICFFAYTTGVRTLLLVCQL
ncbi:hypothetical protein DIPPA_02267 [Diplonema papillatum]|nr:hypothetical protein DIPPA_02267 [Diplonema papillatum]